MKISLLSEYGPFSLYQLNRFQSTCVLSSLHSALLYLGIGFLDKLRLASVIRPLLLAIVSVSYTSGMIAKQARKAGLHNRCERQSVGRQPAPYIRRPRGIQPVIPTRIEKQ